MLDFVQKVDDPVPTMPCDWHSFCDERQKWVDGSLSAVKYKIFCSFGHCQSLLFLRPEVGVGAEFHMSDGKLLRWAGGFCLETN